VEAEPRPCKDGRVATASLTEKAPAHGTLTRPNMVSVGTIVWLSSELMFFAGLFAMYFTLRSATGADNWPPEHVELNVPYAAFFTTILILSSFTCQWGVFKAEEGDVYKMRFWYVVTFLMGLAFVLGQANEYRLQYHHHPVPNTIHTDGYGSVFYLTTGFHGLHVIGGLVAFIFVLIRSTVGTYTPEKATSAIVVSYYWHFVDVVWVGLFATIYLIK
jgi:cytochrome c oxidase subunit 3